MIADCVIGGVDTHGAFHHAVVLDRIGRRLADKEFAANESGYSSMLAWIRSHGTLEVVGVEGTGAYGAGLARYLHRAGIKVIEVARPDRRIRRQFGKSDPIDAEAAARAVLAGTASTTPKLAHGIVESIRMLRVTRTGAMKARTAALNTLRALLLTAPDPLRSQLSGLSQSNLVNVCRRLRPDMTCLNDPTNGAKASLRSVAERNAYSGESDQSFPGGFRSPRRRRPHERPTRGWFQPLMLTSSSLVWV